MTTTTEYHLIDLWTGVSLGGYISIPACRKEAFVLGLRAWDIWRHDYVGNRVVRSNRVEYHDPEHPEFSIYGDQAPIIIKM
jgi:hypothetical protein